MILTVPCVLDLSRARVGELRARQVELPDDLQELQGLWVKP
jgi:hypothetical protein